MRLSFLVPWVVVFACVPSNDLPSPGHCEAEVAMTPPTAVAIALAGTAASFDDLRYSEALDRVLALPRGTGTLYLVDPADDGITAFGGLPSAVTSADATAERIYLSDRGADRVLVLDAATGSIVGMRELGARPDYVRVAPGDRELWVTMPSEHRIAVHALDEAGLPEEVASIAIDGGPEGLVFDATHGRAYAHLFDGDLAVIDVAAREHIDTWSTGCAGAHGFPQVDEARGLVFAGCAAEGAAVVLDTTDGGRLAGFSAGGGEAILAYSSELGHFYLRGDPGGQLAILAVCDSGEMTSIARVDIGEHGHGMAADPYGNVWVCDADRGGLLRVTDPAR